MEGIVDTSEGATGMIPLATMGTLALSGHKLDDCQRFVACHTDCGGNSPLDIGLAWVEGQVESTLAIRKYTNVHHQAFIGDSSIPFQVEQHRLVILVVCRIEAGNVDRTPAQAVSKAGGVERWLPVVRQV